MFNYFQVSSDNIVIHTTILQGETEFPEIFKIVPDEWTGKAINGLLWDEEANTFSIPTVVDTNTYLHITTPAPTTVNTDITVTVDIKDAAGNLVSVNSTYYVPVMRTSDNVQALLLVVNFVNGQASNTFQIKDSGIYTIRLDNISPKPTSILESNVELIVV